jgi:hypothetical protein
MRRRAAECGSKSLQKWGLYSSSKFRKRSDIDHFEVRNA